MALCKNKAGQGQGEEEGTKVGDDSGMHTIHLPAMHCFYHYLFSLPLFSPMGDLPLLLRLTTYFSLLACQPPGSTLHTCLHFILCMSLPYPTLLLKLLCLLCACTHCVPTCLFIFLLLLHALPPPTYLPLLQRAYMCIIHAMPISCSVAACLSMVV